MKSFLVNKCVNLASEWLTALQWTAQVAAVLLVNSNDMQQEWSDRSV